MTEVVKLYKIGDRTYETRGGLYDVTWESDAGHDGKGLWLIRFMGSLCDGAKTLSECRILIAGSEASRQTIPAAPCDPSRRNREIR